MLDTKYWNKIKRNYARGLIFKQMAKITFEFNWLPFLLVVCLYFFKETFSQSSSTWTTINAFLFNLSTVL